MWGLMRWVTVRKGWVMMIGIIIGGKDDGLGMGTGWRFSFMALRMIACCVCMCEEGVISYGVIVWKIMRIGRLK